MSNTGTFDPFESAFRQKADMGMIFVRQLDRKNHQGSTDYANSVIITLNNLPKRWRDWVSEQEDKYTIYEWTLVYKTSCGVKLGTAETPLVYDDKLPLERFEDGSINYDDPNIISPKLKELKHIDYTIMDAIVAEAAEYAALTWTVDPLEQDAGDTEEYIIERKRTPFRKPRLPDTEG